MSLAWQSVLLHVLQTPQYVPRGIRIAIPQGHFRWAHQCAHWFAMTEEDHALSQPPHHPVAFDADLSASKTFPFGEGGSACADGRGKSSNVTCRLGWFRYPAVSPQSLFRRLSSAPSPKGKVLAVEFSTANEIRYCLRFPSVSLRTSDRCHWRGNPFSFTFCKLRSAYQGECGLPYPKGTSVGRTSVRTGSQ